MDIENRIVQGVVLAMIAAIGGLFLRVRTNESRIAVLESAVKGMPDLAKTVVAIDKNLAVLQAHVAGLPDHDDQQRLHDRIAENRKLTTNALESIAAMNATLGGVRQAVDRLHTVEMERR